MKNTFIILFLFVICTVARGQFSFAIREIDLRSVDDLDVNYLSGEWFSEDAEFIIDYGPYIIIRGDIRNLATKEVQITGKKLKFEVMFSYRGKKYKVRQFPISPFGYYDIDEEFIPPSGTINDVVIECFLFYGTQLDNLSKSGKHRRRANIRKGRRLEKLAKTVIPSLQVCVTMDN